MKKLYTNKRTYAEFDRGLEEFSNLCQTIKRYPDNVELVEQCERRKKELNIWCKENDFHSELITTTIEDEAGNVLYEVSNEYTRNPFQKAIGYFGMNEMGGDTYKVFENGKLNKSLTNTFNGLFGA